MRVSREGEQTLRFLLREEIPAEVVARMQEAYDMDVAKLLDRVFKRQGELWVNFGANEVLGLAVAMPGRFSSVLQYADPSFRAGMDFDYIISGVIGKISLTQHQYPYKRYLLVSGIERPELRHRLVFSIGDFFCSNCYAFGRITNLGTIHCTRGCDRGWGYRLAVTEGGEENG